MKADTHSPSSRHVPEQARIPAPVFPSRYQVGLVVVLGAVFLIGLAPRIDTDLWWHLKDGSYIANHHSIPTGDFYSFTFAGHQWTNHEWLTELLLYGLYRLAGLWGPIVFFAGVICATFGLVYWRMADEGANRMLSLFVLVAAFIASSTTWGARPQMLTLFFLAVYGLVLGRFTATHNRRLLVIFPLTMLLWTNIHGGWVLGLVLLILTVAGEWLNRRTGREGALTSGNVRALAITTVVTVLVTSINPNGIRQVLYPFVWIFPSPFSNAINEWLSVDFHQAASMVFEAMLLVLIAAFYVVRPKINWSHLFLILSFTHLALSQARNVAVWSVVISPFLALYVHRALLARRSEKSAGGVPAPAMKPSTERLLNITLLVSTSLLYVVETFHFVSPAALRSAEATSYPQGATTYMAAHRLPPNTFASYAWGGYLVWKLYPRYRDFIDGRANTLFDSRVLAEYMDAYGAAPHWRSVLTREQVRNVLIPPGAPLAQILAQDSGWRRAYQDPTAVLFTRR